MSGISIDVITTGIIIFTCIFSFKAFGNEAMLSKYSFMPYQIRHHREHHRFLSHAFVHADEMHLFLNMFGLYMFGTTVEKFLRYQFGNAAGEVLFLVFYTSAIYAASLPQFFREKNNRGFSSIGASGAVNAIVFATIFVLPNKPLYLFILPLPLKAWMFGLIYLGITYALARRKSKNRYIDMIDHSAHFWGAAYGIVFMCAIKPSLLQEFFLKIASGR
jgi:membrane associated rhomboid family serine protease